MTPFDEENLQFAEAAIKLREVAGNNLPTSWQLRPLIQEDVSETPSGQFSPPPETEMRRRSRKHITCPSASIACDSVSASKSKCGFGEFGTPSTPPKFYLKQVGTYSQKTFSHVNKSGETGTFACNCYTNDDTNDNHTVTQTYDKNSCRLTTTAAGTYVEIYDTDFSMCHAPYGGHYTRTSEYDYATASWSYISTGSGGGTCCPFIFGTPVYNSGYTTVTDSTHETVTEPCHTITGTAGSSDSLCTIDARYGFQGSGTCGVWDYELSDEYTTSQLKSNVIAALPAFDGVYDDTCGATYNLSTDETSFTLSRTQYVINFSSPLCKGAVVSWVEQFAPTSGGTSNTNKNYTSTAGGETQIGPFTIPDPTANGTTTPMSVSVDCSNC